MTAVSNTSPLLRFSSIGRLDLLKQKYGDVIIPPAVWSEVIIDGGRRPGAADVASAAWIRRQAPAATALLARLVEELGAGEAEAIALASELGGATPVLLDDRKGRRIARELGLSVVGTAGMLLAAKHSALIPLVRPLLDELRTAGL
jgi:predicted nucleic acid-binding protein